MGAVEDVTKLMMNEKRYLMGRWRTLGVERLAYRFMAEMKYKLRERGQLTSARFTKTHVRDWAWVMAEQRYPAEGGTYVDETPLEEEGEDEDGLHDLTFLRAKSDVLEDVRWVYAHLSDKNAVPKTRGAHAMLKWGRKSPDKFYQIIGNRVITKEMADKAAQEDSEYKPTKQEKIDTQKLIDTFETITTKALKRKVGVRVTCPNCKRGFDGEQGDFQFS